MIIVACGRHDTYKLTGLDGVSTVDMATQFLPVLPFTGLGHSGEYTVKHALLWPSFNKCHNINHCNILAHS